LLNAVNFDQRIDDSIAVVAQHDDDFLGPLRLRWRSLYVRHWPTRCLVGMFTFEPYRLYKVRVAPNDNGPRRGPRR
jgi:hypothetical protein